MLVKMRIHAPAYLFFRICLLIVGFQCYPDMYEGDQCRNGFSPGICRKVSDCPPAKEALKLYRNHNLKRCGFKRDEEVVCCPSDDNSIEPTTMDKGEIWTDVPITRRPTETDVRAPLIDRKAELACKKYTSNSTIALTFHIIEGEDAKPGDFPHVGALGFETEDPSRIRFACGGTLISARWVLTAAHCLATRDPIKIVRFGTIDVPEYTNTLTPNDYNISETKPHPKYNFSQKLNDIALLKLKRKVRFTKDIFPACLYTKNDDPMELIITGWGVVQYAGDWHPRLQQANLRPVPLRDCNETIYRGVRKVLTTGHICAKDSKSDACQGDSGGPLQIQNAQSNNIYTIVGVVSYGIGCANDNPSVYTRVYTYLDWIEGLVWP